MVKEGIAGVGVKAFLLPNKFLLTNKVLLPNHFFKLNFCCQINFCGQINFSCQINFYCQIKQIIRAFITIWFRDSSKVKGNPNLRHFVFANVFAFLFHRIYLPLRKNDISSTADSLTFWLSDFLTLWLYDFMTFWLYVFMTLWLYDFLTF